MESARILSYELHQLIEAKWFEALEDEPADPERYSRTSVAQVHRANYLLPPEFHVRPEQRGGALPRLRV